MMNSLKDKVAVITGASRGIGFAIVQELEKQGVRLVLTAKENLSALKSFKSAKIIKLNLAKKEDINLLVEETLKTFGRIDILINNAAYFKQTDFELISEEELDDIIDIDFKGPFLLMQRVFTQMKKQKMGKIINIASGAGIMGSSKASHYAACKAALISLTKSIAKLGGPYNINVNAIAPGFIETDMSKELFSGGKDIIESFIPLKRIGTVQDISGVVRFLASSDSDYITGQTICVDGGHCMV
ncbi:MAG: 3-oxoacyl-ACP reductase family protein [Candidatus Omnitrophota bacterium]